jgi:hypothetical protein
MSLRDFTKWLGTLEEARMTGCRVKKHAMTLAAELANKDCVK